MTIWLVILMVSLTLTALALVYLSHAVARFFPKWAQSHPKYAHLIGAGIVLLSFAGVGMALDFVNAVICAIYFALIWVAVDLAFRVIRKVRHRPFKRYYAGLVAVVLSLFALSAGWYWNHNVWQTHYSLITPKRIQPLKIVMFADSHLGTTFDADGFARHITSMQALNPDVVIVVGDFVDDGTTRKDMVKAAEILGSMRTKYGVFFVHGNHDKGYYSAHRRGFSGSDLETELEKNGVRVLKDEVVPIAGSFYLIGRQDLSVEKERRGHRKTMAELTEGLDKSKYIIVADHQPADYKNQAAAKVDLVLSGHTHGGQLYPFNQVGKWIGANDFVYGYDYRDKTGFIVTSGLSDWAIKFKTGTKSEYVLIKLAHFPNDFKLLD